MRVASWQVLPVNTSEAAEVIPSVQQLTCCQSKTVRAPSLTILSTPPVNDDSTSVLRQRFHEFLATGEFTKAEAPRQGQLSMLYAEDAAAYTHLDGCPKMLHRPP